MAMGPTTRRNRDARRLAKASAAPTGKGGGRRRADAQPQGVRAGQESGMITSDFREART
jgi:hypothetical protein